MTREDIITAAFRVWGRDLYRTTSLTQLAGDLGVTKPALYRHFPHKRALLEGMYEWFFDDYTAYIKAGYDDAVAAGDSVEGMLILGRAVARYYCRNMDVFLFSLIQVYGSQDQGFITDKLAERGIDMRKLRFPPAPDGSGAEGETPYPSLLRLITVTLMCWTAFYHKHRIEAGTGDAPYSACNWDAAPSSEEDLKNAVAGMEEKILNGLGFDRARIDGLDYEDLERRVTGLIPENIEDDGLYRAVAEVLAEAGPWDVSMDMVARRSGLSKSGLYAHFRNKQDMIRQYFGTEFERIIASAGAGKAGSTVPEEQLYLAIIAIADYFRGRPEILLALDRLRTRKPDMEIPEPPLFYRVFAGINLIVPDAGCSDEGPEAVQAREDISQWILFLIVNILRSGEAPGNDAEMPAAETVRAPAFRSRFREVENSSFRILYRFVVSGIRGFVK
ncbi:MAG: TetR/AcrR family transcriptional regulator [Treponema sp.]|jgi:AcrR family transcriptional regulator|nr:TetR/AcrR family transcriptional regulator [Treponema sp.]